MSGAFTCMNYMTFGMEKVKTFQNGLQEGFNESR